MKKFLNLIEPNCPMGYLGWKTGNHILFYNVVFDKNEGFPTVQEAFKVDKDLHAQLSYKNQFFCLLGLFKKEVQN